MHPVIRALLLSIFTAPSFPTHLSLSSLNPAISCLHQPYQSAPPDPWGTKIKLPYQPYTNHTLPMWYEPNSLSLPLVYKRLPSHFGPPPHHFYIHSTATSHTLTTALRFLLPTMIANNPPSHRSTKLVTKIKTLTLLPRTHKILIIFCTYWIT